MTLVHGDDKRDPLTFVASLESKNLKVYHISRDARYWYVKYIFKFFFHHGEIHCFRKHVVPMNEAVRIPWRIEAEGGEE